MKVLRKKQQKEILMRIAANHIMARKIADKLHDTTEMSCEEYFEYVEHLTDNTVKSSSLVGGLNGMMMVKSIIESKGM